MALLLIACPAASEQVQGTRLDSARTVWSCWSGAGARYETYHRRGTVAMAIEAVSVASHHGSALRQ